MDFNVVTWPVMLHPLRRAVLERFEEAADSGLFAQTLPDSAHLLFSVASREVMPLLGLWIDHAKRVKDCDVAIMACDPETADFVRARNVRCAMVSIPDASTLAAYSSETGFSARGLLSTALKFPTVSAALRQYERVTFVDIDALVVRPFAQALRSNADIAFQRDWHYPKPMVTQWGLAVCTGFASFRNNAAVTAFLAQVRHVNETCYSDQVAFNLALQSLAPTWHWPANAGSSPTPVQSQERFRQSAALDVMGSTQDPPLTLQALPADAFYRHHWIPCDRKRLVVYHPNLQKDVAMKAAFLADFAQFGHRYAHFRLRMRRRWARLFRH